MRIDSLTRLIAGGAIAACLAGHCLAASRAGTASITIQQANSQTISQKRTEILSFGHFKNEGGKNCRAGTIDLNPETGKLATTGTVSLFLGTAAATYGVFEISGTPNSIYEVTLPISSISAPNKLPVDDFKYYSVTTRSMAAAKIGPGGTDTLQIGAVLSVPCNINTSAARVETVPSYAIVVSYQ